MTNKQISLIMKDIKESENGKVCYPLMQLSNIDVIILESYGIQIEYEERAFTGIVSDEIKLICPVLSLKEIEN